MQMGLWNWRRGAAQINVGLYLFGFVNFEISVNWNYIYEATDIATLLGVYNHYFNRQICSVI